MDGVGTVATHEGEHKGGEAEQAEQCVEASTQWCGCITHARRAHGVNGGCSMQQHEGEENACSRHRWHTRHTGGSGGDQEAKAKREGGETKRQSRTAVVVEVVVVVVAVVVQVICSQVVMLGMA